MAYNNNHYQQPQLGATFVPGGFDDYYIPASGPELISPAPQRIMPEVPEQMQDNLAHLEKGVQPSAQQWNNPPQNTFQPPPHNTPSQSRLSVSYASHAPPEEDLPNFSPFPTVKNPPSNVPPTDDSKEAILSGARMTVLNSNDPEMQLAWAQDALLYVETSQKYDERSAELDNKPRRPTTPGVEHQIKTDAVNIVEFLANQGHPKATFMKGMWLEFGSFGQRMDKKEAFRCYSRASEKGYARALYRMGMQFEQNNDPVKALVHYKRGAEANDSAANYRLGMATLMGQIGQPQDFGKAVSMLRQAAASADENAPQAPYVLGMLYARELPNVVIPELFLSYDQRLAKENIEKAAYLGFAKAQVKMGLCYELSDLGCAFDAALSLHYDALAARQGEPDAEMAISKWFLCGQENVFKKNDELAYVYAHRAAQSGLANAEFALGYFNEIGLHVPVNLKTATEWYEKAAAQGNEDAKGRIAALNKSQQLSKKDHEAVALNRIRSQYGSKRGGRPPRFSLSEAPPLPALPSTADEPKVHSAPSTGAVPPRGTTPYPMEDGPPKVPAPDRPATVTPYPLEDPSIPSGRLSGGFAPDIRSSSARPQQIRPHSGEAFGINPAVYTKPQQSTYLGPPQHAASLPIRPNTTVASYGGSAQGPPNLRPQGNNRIASGPAGVGGYSPNGAQGSNRPPRIDSQGAPPPPSKSDFGYAAPNSAGGRPQIQQNSLLPQDIGYIAPLQPKPAPPPHNPHAEPGVTAPARLSSVGNRVPVGGGAPRPAGQQQPQQQAPSSTQGRPPRIDSAPHSQHSSAPAAPPKQSVPAAAPKPAPPTGHAPPKKPVAGNGPKTFEAMGVPQATKESDCVVM